MKKNNSNKHKIFYCYSLISIILFLLFIISCGSASLNSNVPVDVYVGGNSFISTTNVPVAVYWKNGEMVILSKEYSRVTSIAVKGSDVYAGGYIIKFDPSIPSEYEVASITVPGYWKNGKWVGLSVLASKKSSSVETIFVAGDDVYTGGYSTDRSNNSVAGYWKNGKWVGLSVLASKKSSTVKTIIIDGNDIYAGGYSTDRSNNSVAGYWKNGKWVGLTSDSGYNSCINSIFVVNNDIYACGYMSGKGIRIPVYWKNGECVELISFSDKKYGDTNSFFVSNNNVYVCGISKNSSGEYIACYWKNSEIKPLLSSDPKYELRVTSLFVSGKDVYIGGYLNHRYYTPFASIVGGYWKNSEWITLKPMDNKENSEVSSIFVFGKDVYAGGYCNNSNGDHIPGYWKNGEWVDFNIKGGEVSSIVVVPRPIGQ